MSAVSNLNDVQSPSTSVHHHVIRAVGGTTAITKVTGPGVAVTRTGTGTYLLTWSQAPGNILGVVASLQATTPTNLVGHSVVCGAYDATAKTMVVRVGNAADAAHDLAANEWFTVAADFSFSNLDL